MNERTQAEHIEAYEERAAIMQHDGGLSRLEAQRLAYFEWRRQNEGVPAPQQIIELAMEYRRHGNSTPVTTR